MDWWITGWMCRWRMVKWINMWIGGQLCVCTVWMMDGLICGSVNGWMTVGWINRCIDGWMSLCFSLSDLCDLRSSSEWTEALDEATNEALKSHLPLEVFKVCVCFGKVRAMFYTKLLITVTTDICLCFRITLNWAHTPSGQEWSLKWCHPPNPSTFALCL